MTTKANQHGLWVARCVVAACLFLQMLNSVIAATEETACEWGVFQTYRTIEQKRAVFRTCSSERQVDLFLKWSFATIPENDDLLTQLAEQGANIIPAILARIERTSNIVDPASNSRLIFVLAIMQKLGYYEVRRDDDLMARLKKSIATIPEPEFREWEEDMLDSIRNSGH